MTNDERRDGARGSTADVGTVRGGIPEPRYAVYAGQQSKCVCSDNPLSQDHHEARKIRGPSCPCLPTLCEETNRRIFKSTVREKKKKEKEKKKKTPSPPRHESMFVLAPFSAVCLLCPACPLLPRLSIFTLTWSNAPRLM